MSLSGHASQLARIVRTVRWLKPSQTVGRVLYRLARPRVDPGPAPPRREVKKSFAPCDREPSLVGPQRLSVLGTEVEIGAGVWDLKEPKLAAYHLHYFDDLIAEGCSERRPWHEALLRSWLDENPPPRGVGWEPYVVSLRLVNWIKVWLGSNSIADRSLQKRLERSGAVHARWLSQRLEVHLLGNHLWTNAKALVFAGCAFGGEEGDRWLRRGLDLVTAELQEQILSDGGHYELSPMYQAIVLEDVLDLIQLSECVPGALPDRLVSDLRVCAARMTDWMRIMTHPDGKIAQFNDASLMGHPSTGQLEHYAERLEIEATASGTTHLSASGYCRLERGQAVVIADVACVGPDYIPGHAHADTLSFEMSLGGHRLFVNGGTSTYQRDAIREAERGTASHNTVVINGSDSSEVWASFRVGRRARPFGVVLKENSPEVCLDGSHDGYRHLSGKPLHHRKWKLDSNRLVIVDEIEGQTRSAVAHFRVHPDWSVTQEAEGIRLRRGQLSVLFRSPGASPSIAEDFWAPGFGKRVRCSLVTVPVTTARTMTFVWGDS